MAAQNRRLKTLTSNTAAFGYHRNSLMALARWGRILRTRSNAVLLEEIKCQQNRL
jgi:hypothetical protein